METTVVSNTESRLIVRTHTFVVTPAMLGVIMGYAKYFRNDLARKLDEFQQEYQESEHTAQEQQRTDELVATVLEEIQRAEVIGHDIGLLSDELSHLYRWHFERIAQVFSAARTELGASRIEQLPGVLVVLKHLMALLEAENPKFSRERFLAEINRSSTN